MIVAVPSAEQVAAVVLNVGTDGKALTVTVTLALLLDASESAFGLLVTAAVLV